MVGAIRDDGEVEPTESSRVSLGSLTAFFVAKRLPNGCWHFSKRKEGSSDEIF
ncbi:MAG: hypothetical protein Q8906_02445 [Bacillota bacterium]|nr:hypothetical protein [Bacillota bacterium]MDP4169440.1 hypothetical protein [Bacillota bacterium]